MIHGFNFIGFDPSEDLKQKAGIALDRLINMAPYGSMPVALLEQDGSTYRCGIEIYSKHGPFTARGSDTSPEQALEAVVRSLSKKLERWKTIRFENKNTKYVMAS